MHLSAKIRYAITLILAGIGLQGCSRDIHSTDTVSPGGDLILRVEINEGGGAAVSDATSVYILLSGAPSDKGKLIFNGSAMSTFKAAWNGPQTITISYVDGYVSSCDSAPTVSSGKTVRVIGCK